MASVGWRVFGRDPGEKANAKEKPLSGIFTTGYGTAEEYAKVLRDKGYTVTGIQWTGKSPPKSG